MAKELRPKVAEVFEVTEQFISGNVTYAFWEATLLEMTAEDAKQYARIVSKRAA